MKEWKTAQKKIDDAKKAAAAAGKALTQAEMSGVSVDKGVVAGKIGEDGAQKFMTNQYPSYTLVYHDGGVACLSTNNQPDQAI